MLPKKTIVLAASLIVLAAIGAFLRHNFQNKPQSYGESRLLMDTLITIKAFPPDSMNAVDRAFAVFAAVEEMASFHKPRTELAKLNSLNKLAPTASFSQLINCARYYYDYSEGYFDPAFASLQKAYGFYDGVGRLPAEDEIQAILKESCGLSKVLHEDNTGNLVLASGSMLDLGGLAGGYAIELAAEVLRRNGCSAFLIDDAGDIWFEGKKPDNTPWRIAVRDPRDNGVLAMIETGGPLAISTSGDYERFITVAGRRYGHIMSPHTGRPVDYYSSVTIIASSAIAADALSTAVFAMPPQKAFSWCDERGLAALFLTATGSIHLSVAGRTYFSEVKMP